MSKNIRESQQQGEGIAIGTQGNENMPTPLGDDLNYRVRGPEDRHIPNQDKSSATNQRRAEEDSEENNG